jgi:hypothetical protein
MKPGEADRRLLALARRAGHPTSVVALDRFELDAQPVHADLVGGSRDVHATDSESVLE